MHRQRASHKHMVPKYEERRYLAHSPHSLASEMVQSEGWKSTIEDPCSFVSPSAADLAGLSGSPQLGLFAPSSHQ